MQLRRTGLLSTAIAAFSLLGLVAASAQDKNFELKLSHWVPPSHPLQKALEEWGASIAKRVLGLATDAGLGTSSQQSGGPLSSDETPNA